METKKGMSNASDNHPLEFVTKVPHAGSMSSLPSSEAMGAITVFRKDNNILFPQKIHFPSFEY